jgi:predicted DNA-binding protein (MmcQ/YjbR family)
MASDPLSVAEEALRSSGLAFPETHEAFPWGHRALKVRGKAFAFLAAEGDTLSVSVKLPLSAAEALELPCAEPTGYGLGKSGWVTLSFGPGDDVPLPTLQAWLEESYRAIAPKKLAARLPDRA